MTILTVGYGNRGFPSFIELLKALGVTHLVDVRSVPQSSYWEDFRLERLQRLVPETGLKFIYMGDTLGAVQGSNAACREPSLVDFEALKAEERLKRGLDQLERAAAAPERVICLMCGCLRPETCHRSRLLGPALTDRGIAVLHVDADGQKLSQAEVEALWPPAQASLF